MNDHHSTAMTIGVHPIAPALYASRLGAPSLLALCLIAPSLIGCGGRDATPLDGTTTTGGESATTSAPPSDTGAGATASSAWDWERWDTDDDALVTESETLGGFEVVTADWDGDGDPGLSNVEMSNALFSAWDTDGDGRLETAEFEAGAQIWFGDRWSYAGFTDWDADGDAELTLQEFNVGLDDMAMYDAFDEDDDAHVNAPDFARIYHDVWDRDGDGTIQIAEWPWME